jgi:hypothetical protein
MLAVAVLGIVIMRFGKARPTLHREDIERIGVGMTRAEVESALGCPPGEYNSRPVQTAPLGLKYSHMNGWDSWICDEGEIMVQYDKRDIVIENV